MFIFSGSLGSSSNRSKAQVEIARKEFSTFFDAIQSNALVAFTDGSVLGSSCVGNGGYGVVIHKKGEDPEVFSGTVGRMTDNVTCEVKGIIEALRRGAEKCSEDRSIDCMFVFTD